MESEGCSKPDMPKLVHELEFCRMGYIELPATEGTVYYLLQKDHVRFRDQLTLCTLIMTP